VKRTIAIVGNDRSIFPRSFARAWRACGYEPVLVSLPEDGPYALEDGTPVLDAREGAGAAARDLAALAQEAVAGLEAELLRLDGPRYQRALGEFASDPYRPALAPYAFAAPLIAEAVRRLDPLFVVGHEVFAYGLATSLCHGVPRVLVPWGGDIFYFAETTALAFAQTRLALRSVERVCPTSSASARQLTERFGVAPGRVRPVSWGVDRSRFARADGARRAQVLSALGIPPQSSVVFNIRRFKPPWGSEVALEAFLEAARAAPRAHFVCAGGAGAAGFVDAARERVRAAGLADRFTLLREDVPLEVYASILSVADVGVSLMLSRDMRSSSIVQAAASGSALLLSAQPEYQEMGRLGFEAVVVDPRDGRAVVRNLLALLERDDLRRHVAARNASYVAEHEDADRQMRRLLEECLSAGGRRA
jgi:glycosyltransferase involved in cell wall biosynthesis